MSGVRMSHFLKDLWKFVQIHQYYYCFYTVYYINPALTVHIHVPICYTWFESGKYAEQWGQSQM